MVGRIEERFNALDSELPQPTKPCANYASFVKLRRGFTTEERQQAERPKVLNLIAPVKMAAHGYPDRACRCIREAGFPNAIPYNAALEVDVFIEVK